MGRTKQHPRYNVLSCRVSDSLKQSINHALGSRTMQQFMHEAAEAKLIEERQARVDKIVAQAKRAANAYP